MDRPNARVNRGVVARGVAHAPAEIGRDWRQVRLGRQRARLFDQPFLVAREARMAVHAIELERHPVGAKVALLEDIGADAAQRGNPARGDMIGTTIPEQQDVRDLVFTQKVVEEHRPIAETPAEIGCRLRPIQAVAGADVDAFDLHATLAHGRRPAHATSVRGDLAGTGRRAAPACKSMRAAAVGPWPERVRRTLQEAEISSRSVHWTRLLRRRLSLPCSRRMPTSSPASRSPLPLSRATTTSAGQGRPVIGSR